MDDHQYETKVTFFISSLHTYSSTIHWKTIVSRSFWANIIISICCCDSFSFYFLFSLYVVEFWFHFYFSFVLCVCIFIHPLSTKLLFTVVLHSMFILLLFFLFFPKISHNLEARIYVFLCCSLVIVFFTLFSISFHSLNCLLWWQYFSVNRLVHKHIIED